ncbi:NAD-binding protein [Rhodobacterales bacterium HKCCSP123]|nr:NAD-binding protein [Rhodobacterales bacterium HKCCSP123]
MSERIGLIGLGAMGAGMGRNLLAKTGGLQTMAHRDRAVIEALVAEGATEHADAAAVAAASDVVVLCLPNSTVVESVLDQMAPVLRPGQVVIDTGTSALASTLALAERLAAQGVEFAEAPLTGGAQQAADGVLGALVGATPEGFARAAPVLSAFCERVEHFGPVGAGARAKFINNYMVMGIAALVTEAFRAAADEGIDWGQLHDVVQCGSANSGVLNRIMGKARDGDFSGYVFSVGNAAKDMRYIADYLESSGHDTPMSRAVHDLFQRAEAQGHGARRISELLRPEIRGALFAGS